MLLIRTLFSRLASLLRRQELEEELDEELRAHIDMAVGDNLRSGMSEQAARAAALRQFGGLAQIKEAYRVQQGIPFLETMMQDVRYALRRLAKSPGFTFTVLLTLALGVGANTGIFTLLNAVLLKSLPVPDPEQLFLVKQGNSPADETLFSYPFFKRLIQQLPDSAALAAMSYVAPCYVGAGHEPRERALGQLVSGNYFQVFETHPVLGRLLSSSDDNKSSSNAAAVISYSYWRQHFAADPDVIGHKFDVNGEPFTIVGVVARGFFGARPGSQPDFWVPLTMQSEVRYHGLYRSQGADPAEPWSRQEKIEWLQGIVRVKNSAAVTRLLAVMNQQYRQTQELLSPDANDMRRQQAISQNRLSLEPGQQGFATLRQQFKEPLFLLMGMAVLVLLISCANIANLVLARAVAQERSHALQLALGADRMRLVQQMLTESLLLSTCGGALGIAIAFWCTRVLPKWIFTEALPIALNLTPDARVLLFSLAIGTATGVLFGLVPAVRSARVNPASAIRASAANIAGHGASGRWSAGKTLVASQVALSLVLLVGAGMFLRTLGNYRRLDTGFNRSRILSAHLSTNLVGYKSNEYLPLYRKLIERVNRIPGVRSSAVATCAISDHCPDATDVVITETQRGQRRPLSVQFNRVSLDYFKTVGIRLFQGRDFKATDNASSPGVALVNQTYVKRFLNNDGNPVGKEFLSRPDNGPEHYEIVGVVTDARVNDIRQTAPPLIYFPISQHPGNIDTVEIRTAAGPRRIEAQVRQAVTDVDYRLPIVEITPLADQLARNLTQERMITRVTTIFGLLALALACLGLYGVMSYTVQRRTSEIGVRLAIGSTRPAILWMILKETLLVIGAGAVFGVAISTVTTRLATRFLFGLSPEDPVTIASAAGLLFLISMAAGILAARRAVLIDPVQALRME